MGGGGWGYIPALQCHHRKDFCITMGSDESHFHAACAQSTTVEENGGEPPVSHQKDFCITMGSDESHFHAAQCPQTTTVEENGEPPERRIEPMPSTLKCV